MVANEPADGLARLTSAMTPIPGSRSAAITSSDGGAAAAAALILERLTRASRAATSALTPSRMESSTFAGLMPVVPLALSLCTATVNQPLAAGSADVNEG